MALVSLHAGTKPGTLRISTDERFRSRPIMIYRNRKQLEGHSMTDEVLEVRMEPDDLLFVRFGKTD